MRKPYLYAILAAALLSVASCADEGTVTVPTAVPDDTGLAGEMAETVAELEAEVDELQTAIEESEAAAELNDAWQTLSVEVTAAIAEIRADGAIAREEIESELDEFERRIDELEVEENVRSAWDALRSHLEQLVS